MVLRLLYVYQVCLFVCASALTTYTIITSHKLLPCDITLVDLTAALQFEYSTGVATVLSLAQLQVQDAEEQRQRRHEADREWNRWKQAATCDAYRVTNQLRVATRRAQKWIRMFECPADFFDMKHHTCLLDIVLN